ncbi:tyrosine--tRNA ligase [Pueribacillus sp. YX66]|uniref:tyrosine--tRNA ligase n=1 Tax=Pueribacillus sp. YX66 TaxID=3229242 RepID=UPI00358D994B
MDILQDLENRGLLNQVTDFEGLKKHLDENQVTLYCGFDPTADSLHIGHLLPVTMLKRFQQVGHKPIALIGGGTGMIGDPSGRTSERTLNEENVVHGFAKSLRNQLARLLDFEEGENAAVARNNYDWLSKLTIIDFLRDAGKHFTVNYMLAKDSVSSRIEQGISYTEFSYMLLQSYDFAQLYKEENCTLQIGGSDQWGNITAGLEFIRRSREHEEEDVKAFGLTVPLITKADGTKFGKTAGGAVWLDAKKTSPYEFYQFWFNTDDRDVVKFLKYFTFLSLDEIAELEKAVKTSPEKREAQKTLAEEMTKFVHGEDALQQAINISNALFTGDIKELTVDEMKQGFKDVPSHTLESDEPIGLVDLLVESKISSSKRQAREDINNGAIYINGERTKDLKKMITRDDAIERQFIVIRRGKKRYFVIRYPAK